MSIRLETSDTPSARLALELGKFKPNESMSSSVKGGGNRPPTIKEILKNRETKND